MMASNKQKRDERSSNVAKEKEKDTSSASLQQSQQMQQQPPQQSSQMMQQAAKDKEKNMMMSKDDNASSTDAGAGGSEKVEKDKNTLLYEACVAGDIDYCKSLNPDEVKYEPYVTSASNSVNVNVALCALSKCEDKSKRPAIGQWALENGACFIYTWQHPPSELKKNVDPIKSFGKGLDKH